ncbi:MAG: Glu/Leu/Phe/Val dehydrogenase dimerization domain-containing protein, partial [Candidatus Omnitrophica bacterium]|nr:Glu/Leu/Phe/Val dehydrogenase dimerization domain-containing protein [Candidatus Omnitrophota bacterium]
MKDRINKFLSSIVLIAFLLNGTMSDIAFGLAPSARTDDIAGIEISDIFKIRAALKQELTALANAYPQLTVERLRNVLGERRIAAGTVGQPAGVQLFLNEFEITPRGLYIKPKIRDANGVRRYHVLFSPTGDFEALVYSEKEKSAISPSYPNGKVPKPAMALSAYESARINTALSHAIAECTKLLPENTKNKEGILKDALVEDVEAYAYCVRNNLPLTLTFDPARSGMDKTYKDKSPFRVSVTVFDDGSLAITSVNSCSGETETTLAKGGCRWYQFTDGAKFAAKSAEILSESGRLAEAMGDKNPLWDVFFDGGKTVFLAKPGTVKEKMIRQWVGSSIASGMLCGLYIAGPDMGMGEEEMTWIQDEADKNFAEPAIKEKVLRKLGKDSILATTSRPAYMGSFPHMPWMVTSLGVVVSLVSVLEDSQVLQQHGINVDKDKRTIVVQGFGDVSSGVVKLLLTTYKELGFKITGVSDIDGAIYSEKGLDTDELMRLRLRFESGEKFKLTEAYQTREGEAVERYAGDPDAILYKECTVLMLGAGSNMFTNKKNNTHQIKAKLIVEGANNAFERGLENKLHGMGILYIPGPVANGAGIYTSTEEVIHYHMSKLNGLKDHVLNAITD